MGISTLLGMDKYDILCICYSVSYLYCPVNLIFFLNYKLHLKSTNFGIGLRFS